jgi:type VI secretion system protein ImpB
MPESYQEKLKRVRKPRVHITYDVETEGARVVKELPFVMGVIGDFSGHSTKKLPPLEERKFIEINRDNFDDVMKRMSVGLGMRVENTIKGDNTEVQVDLIFNSLSDFAPASIIRQVEPLRRLLEMRDRLRDLGSKVDRSAELEGILEKVLKNTDELEKLSAALGASGEARGGGSAPDTQPSGESGKQS